MLPSGVSWSIQLLDTFQGAPAIGPSIDTGSFSAWYYSLSGNVLILVETKWIIQQLGQYSFLTEARLLERFWADGDVEHIAKLLKTVSELEFPSRLGSRGDWTEYY